MYGDDEGFESVRSRVCGAESSPWVFMVIISNRYGHWYVFGYEYGGSDGTYSCSNTKHGGVPLVGTTILPFRTFGET